MEPRASMMASTTVAAPSFEMAARTARPPVLKALVFMPFLMSLGVGIIIVAERIRVIWVIIIRRRVLITIITFIRIVYAIP